MDLRLSVLRAGVFAWMLLLRPPETDDALAKELSTPGPCTLCPPTPTTYCWRSFFICSLRLSVTTIFSLSSRFSRARAYSLAVASLCISFISSPCSSNSTTSSLTSFVFSSRAASRSSLNSSAAYFADSIASRSQVLKS